MLAYEDAVFQKYSLGQKVLYKERDHGVINCQCTEIKRGVVCFIFLVFPKKMVAAVLCKIWSLQICFVIYARLSCDLM